MTEDLEDVMECRSIEFCDKEGSRIDHLFESYLVCRYSLKSLFCEDIIYP